MVGHVGGAEQHPREHGGVDNGALRPGDPAVGAGGRQEGEVEGRVVRDDHAAAGEFQERRAGPRRSPARQPTMASVMPVSSVMLAGIGMPGFTSAENSAARLTGAEPDRADLGDASLVGEPSGRLDVDDDKVCWRQERARWQQAGQQAPRWPVAWAATMRGAIAV